MGLIKQGILGGFRKKTGTVVGAYWRTLDVIRALPKSSGKAPTQLQLNQQQKFGLVTSFLSNISALIDVGFKSANAITSPMNTAVSYHLKEAITGAEPNFELDLTKVRFSMGKLELPLEFNAVAEAGGIIKVGWTYHEADDRYIDSTDVLNVLAYNPAKQKFVKMTATASRMNMSFELLLPAIFAGDQVHVYASFSSVKKKLLHSNSEYLGNLTVL